MQKKNKTKFENDYHAFTIVLTFQKLTTKQ